MALSPFAVGGGPSCLEVSPSVDRSAASSGAILEPSTAGEPAIAVAAITCGLNGLVAGEFT